MKHCIGIRKENKDVTERRAPLTPLQVRRLMESHALKVHVEPSMTRVFTDAEYEKAGGLITTDLSECNIILGVKEVPISNLADLQAYMYFSHTIKGQPYNMPMLRHVLDHRITLLDYELVKSREGRRLIFFGNFAGYAGMINSLWTLGQRLQDEGIDSPFKEVQQAQSYENLSAARAAISDAGAQIQKMGLPAEITPLICGFTGYGQVSKGAQSIFELLPVVTIQPEELERFALSGNHSRHVVYRVEFEEKHMFRHRDSGQAFNLQEYFTTPEHYLAQFEQYVPHLTMVINGIFWEPKYPRLITRDYLAGAFAGARTPRLRVIGDISCDIDGSMEATVKATSSDNPVYVYDPLTQLVRDGVSGRGVVVMAVDKLPAELPREATHAFGEALFPFVPELAAADFSRPLGEIKLPPELHQAMIAHQGDLTPGFAYIRQHLG